MAIKTPAILSTLPLSGKALTVEFDASGIFTVAVFFLLLLV